MSKKVLQMDKKPTISVVMISYNHQDFIEEALISVVEQQSDKYDLEVLIVDDGSSDCTQGIISTVQEKYPNLVFPTFNAHEGIRSINKNLNEQIKKARGEYIGFLAGDDKYFPNRFENQIAILQRDNLVELVISDGKRIDVREGKFLGRCQEEKIVRMLQENRLSDIYEYIISNIPSLLIQGYLIKKTLLENVDYFDEEMIADDWVLNIKLFKYLMENNLRAIYVDEFCFQHSIHCKNTSSNIKEQGPRIIQVIKKYYPDHKKNSALSETYVTCFLGSLKKLDFKNAFLYGTYVLKLYKYTVFIVIKRIKKKCQIQKKL